MGLLLSTMKINIQKSKKYSVIKYPTWCAPTWEKKRRNKTKLWCASSNPLMKTHWSPASKNPQERKTLLLVLARLLELRVYVELWGCSTKAVTASTTNCVCVCARHPPPQNTHPLASHSGSGVHPLRKQHAELIWLTWRCCLLPLSPTLCLSTLQSSALIHHCHQQPSTALIKLIRVLKHCYQTVGGGWAARFFSLKFSLKTCSFTFTLHLLISTPQQSNLEPDWHLLTTFYGLLF